MSEAACKKPWLFSSPEGIALCHQILQNQLPYCLHDYQLEGVARILDGQNLVAIIKTGGGKSAYIYMVLIVIQAIQKDKSLCPQAHEAFPLDAAVLLVLPTTSLQEDQVSLDQMIVHGPHTNLQEAKFTKIGLTVKTINTETKEEHLDATHEKDIWKTVVSGVSIISLSPEMLATKELTALLSKPLFKKRLFALCVDEIYLLQRWGLSFHLAFLQIGHIRAQLPAKTIFIGLTATLAIGEPFKQVTTFLGLHERTYHLIRRSNARLDVWLLFRTLRSGRSSTVFPQFNWLLKESGHVLVFCPTISFVFKVAVYLWHLDPEGVISKQTIQLCNSLHSATYNSETLALLKGNRQSQLTITTDKLSVATVVIIDPPDVDDLLQKGGRVWRALLLPPQEPKVIVYLATSSAKKASEIAEQSVNGGSGNKG